MVRIGEIEPEGGPVRSSEPSFSEVQITGLPEDGRTLPEVVHILR